MQNLKARFNGLSTSGKIIIITVPLGFTLLTLLVILLYVVNLKPPISSIVTVENYDSLPISIPPNNRKDLSEQLYYLLSEHFETTEESNSISATIRPDTLINTSTNGTTSISFIIDIDVYKQSYRAHLNWNDNGDWLPQTTSIECAENSLSKYPDVLCYGMYFDSNDISLYLPYKATIENVGEYTVKQRYYPDGTPYLEVAIDSCGDQTILDQALTSAKNWLTANRFNPDDYSFEVPAHYCAGDSL